MVKPIIRKTNRDQHIGADRLYNKEALSVDVNIKVRRVADMDMEQNRTMTLDNKKALQQDEDLLQMLGRGIDDMEAGREFLA